MAGRTVTIRGTGFGIDTRDFAKFSKSLRKSAPEIARSLRTDLRAVGELVAAEARQESAEFSNQIPPTIKVRVSGATVSVVAGSASMAIAGLFELGNTGGSKSASASRKGVFRHPVFGNKSVWVNQPMHPFLTPALLSKEAEVTEAAVNALDKAIASVELDMSA